MELEVAPGPTAVSTDQIIRTMDIIGKPSLLLTLAFPILSTPYSTKSMTSTLCDQILI